MPILDASDAQRDCLSMVRSRPHFVRRMTRAAITEAVGSASGFTGFRKRALLPLLFVFSLLACSDKPGDKLLPSPPTSGTAAIVPTETAKPMEPAKSDVPSLVAPAPDFATNPPAQMASLTIVNGGKCSIDSINKNEQNDGWSIRRGTVINVGGWILDSATNTTSDWAVLRLGLPDQNAHFYYFLTATRGERPDLVQAFGPGPGPKMAAFSLIAATDGLPYGSYKLAVLHQPAAAAQLCELSKTLRIEP